MDSVKIIPSLKPKFKHGYIFVLNRYTELNIFCGLVAFYKLQRRLNHHKLL